MNLKEQYRELKNPLGIHPINWSNDDFKDLGGDIPLETCFSDMQETGYAGTEVGNKFPRDVAELSTVMEKYELRLIGGWHSTYLATNAYAEEEKDFLDYLSFLKAMNASVLIVAECSKSIHGNESAPLTFSPDPEELSEAQWERIYRGLDRLSQVGLSEGLPVVYHHHMGTVVQSEASLDALMSGTAHLNLLFDTGHLAFAGINPAAVLEKYIDRIAHVHLKNVRPDIVRRTRKEGLSFGQAVRAGVYTVPGDDDGGVDYPPLLKRLAKHGYKSWFVIEAEQDPEMANPREYASMARDYLRGITGL